MSKAARQERLKSALYLRLKKRKIFKTFPALTKCLLSKCLLSTYLNSIYEKLRKQFRDTQRVPFMLDKTRKPLFPQLETKKKHFFEK